MSLALPLLFWLLACAGIAFALFYKSLISDRDSRIAELQDERDRLQESQNALIDSTATLKQKNEDLLEKVNNRKAEIDQAKQEFELKFKDLASTILDTNSTKLRRENEEILKPLREKLGEFEKKVDESRLESGKAHISLLEQVKHLSELNKTVWEEAQNLTKALKGDSKAQGNWGELVLEELLQRSGLEEWTHYVVQWEGLGLKNEKWNASKPDVLIKIPGWKHIIIDAKVSLTAYERLVSSDESERQNLLKAHIKSIKDHIDELADKDYSSHSELRTPDIVMMFVPIEASLSLAVQEEQNLFVYGWDRRIALVTPTTLFMSLKTVSTLWNHEKQSQNVQEIANVGGQLYDKFSGFLDDMEEVKGSMEKALKTHEKATSKINGHGGMLGRIQKLQQLWAKTTKQIDDKLQIEE